MEFVLTLVNKDAPGRVAPGDYTREVLIEAGSWGEAFEIACRDHAETRWRVLPGGVPQHDALRERKRRFGTHPR